MSTAHPEHVALEILGTLVLVRCRTRECRDGIARYYGPLETHLWRSPDLVVYCDWPEAGKYLFRARPLAEPPELAGVSVLQAGEAEARPWVYRDPPIPPLALPPLSQRFVGFHGAALVTESGAGLMVLGPRGCGKTTTAMTGVNEHGAGLLTDETIFLHRRTVIVEPFPRALGITVDPVAERKEIVPADEVCKRIVKQPKPMAAAVFLDRASGPGGDYAMLDAEDIFSRLLGVHIDVGCDADEAMVTVAQLARGIAGYRHEWQRYEDLVNAVPFLLSLADRAAG